MATPGHFDENDTSSWYFPTLTHAECENLLGEKDTGTFLVRHSSFYPGTKVICVKEIDEVSHYPIKFIQNDEKTEFKLRFRDEWSFGDIPSLLAFYKSNMLRTTALIKPIGSAPGTTTKSDMDSKHESE